MFPQPQNILLTQQSPPGDIKIVDFGLSRRLGTAGELREILGTPEYVGKIKAAEPLVYYVLLFSVTIFVCTLDYLTFLYIFCDFISAPEILNYEPISTASDLW